MKTKATTTETDLKSKIKAAYQDYVLTEGKNPASVYGFAKSNGFSEDEFYQHFQSFDSIVRDIWESLISNTLTRIENGDEYLQFSVREKILTFYYTLVEELRKQRSYVTFTTEGWIIPGKVQAPRKAIEKVLEPYFEKLISEGYERNELFNRNKVSDFYKKALGLQFWFILDFWVKDSSKDFEDTDAVIEKAVNLGFDLMRENTLDKAFDFAKFLFGRAKEAM